MKHIITYIIFSLGLLSGHLQAKNFEDNSIVNLNVDSNQLLLDIAYPRGFSNVCGIKLVGTQDLPPAVSMAIADAIEVTEGFGNQAFTNGMVLVPQMSSYTGAPLTYMMRAMASFAGSIGIKTKNNMTLREMLGQLLPQTPAGMPSMVGFAAVPCNTAAYR